MGNWKNRRPRRFFYQKQYKDPASSYYDSNEPSHPLPAFTEDGVPSWEKKFCSLVGSVPWQKIVNAKKFMYCHGSVVNWDDSAAEEAFQSAKRRFWGEINGLPCECSLLNPDTYIDEINWNPSIDPELIKDLEGAFFAPDDEAKDCKLECKNKKTRNSKLLQLEDEWNRNPGEVGTPCQSNKDKSQGWNQWPTVTNNLSSLNNSDNPWDSCFSLGNEGTKGAAWGDCIISDKLQGWNHSGNSVDQLKDWNSCTLNNNDSPWEQSFSQKNESAKDNTWKDSNDNPVNQPKDWDSSGNPWKRSCQAAGHLKMWGECSHSYWENNQMELGKMNNGGYLEGKFGRGSDRPADRQWRQNGRGRSGWRRSDDHYREPKDVEFRPSGDRGTWSQGHRKREGRHQYIAGNKHVRFQENDYQTGHYWRSGTIKKRVSFPFE